MKVVFISVWYSEGMGYSENKFPKALAKFGVEVHLLTSTAQIYYYSPNYDKVYKPYLGPKFVEPCKKELDGYTLHRLPYYETKNIYKGPGIVGLYEYLEKLKPDVIQTFELHLETTVIAAKYAEDKGCLLFTESHTHASVFRKNNQKTYREKIKSLVNSFNSELKLINTVAKRCYPIAEDVAELAKSFFKVPARKIKVQSLGVDTDTFYPPENENEKAKGNEIRQKFEFSASDIICIYTGRFTKDKNPHCLAKAINVLNEQGFPFKGLFVGNGTEEDIQFIKSQNGCLIGSFVPANQLPAYYWASDIGVWPREESTSQLDAMACGLPLILSNQIKVMERVDGNGLLYEEGNYQSLISALKQMENKNLRDQMAKKSVEKIREKFSWDIIASERLNDYKAFIQAN